MYLVFSTEHSFHLYYADAVLQTVLPWCILLQWTELFAYIQSTTTTTRLQHTLYNICRVSEASSSPNRQQMPVAYTIIAYLGGGLYIRGVAWVRICRCILLICVLPVYDVQRIEESSPSIVCQTKGYTRECRYFCLKCSLFGFGVGESCIAELILLCPNTWRTWFTRRRRMQSLMHFHWGKS